MNMGSKEGREGLFLFTALMLTTLTAVVKSAAINKAAMEMASSTADLTNMTFSSTPSIKSDSVASPAVSTTFFSPAANWLVGNISPKTWKGPWPPLPGEEHLQDDAAAQFTAKSAPSAESTQSEPSAPAAHLPLYPPYSPPVTDPDDGNAIQTEQQSVDSVGMVQAQIECPEKSGVQAYAHPEECDQFYLCTNGTLTLERCQNGLLFKGGPGSVHNHCHYHWDVDCSQRHKDMVALSTESCEYQFGIYPEVQGNGCSGKYVVCEFGRAQISECAAGLAYDPRTHRCNWPDEMMDMKCEPSNLLGFDCPDGMPEDPVSARFWPYPRFALKGDCQRLITCVNGQPRLVTCDADMVVDETTLTCEEPELVPNCAHFAKQEKK